MADPQHTPALDGFDRLSVRAYRTGLVTLALGLAAVAALLASGRDADPAWLAVWVGGALAIWNLHLYDKRVRWTLHGLGWSGLVLRVVATGVPAALAPTVAFFGTGLMLAAASGLVFKEWFCFRIPLVRLTPLALATGVIAAWAGDRNVAAVAIGAGALGVAAVAVAKLRMPLGHDIGDRRHYQI